MSCKVSSPISIAEFNVSTKKDVSGVTDIQIISQPIHSLQSLTKTLRKIQILAFPTTEPKKVPARVLDGVL